jgi:hypothetical protein
MTHDAKPWLLAALGRSGFFGRYPAYAHVMARLGVVEDPQVQVMAVSFSGAAYRLHVNTTFFEGRAQYIDGVLLHEIHHIVYNHCELARRLDPVYPDLLELAKETAANEYIAEPLPGKPVRWQDFAHLRFQAGQSTLERYELLADARRQGRLRESAREPLDDHRLHDAAAESDGAGSIGALAQLLQAVSEAPIPVPGGPRPLLAGSSPADLLRHLQGAVTKPIVQIDWRHELGLVSARGRAAD